MHVKPEHGMKDLDDDDDLEDDEDEDRRSTDMLGHHNHRHHTLPQQMNRHHQHNIYVKDQISKPPSASIDCGIPLPASKPKIWSLADTAACKTPPPMHVQQQSTWCTSAPPTTTNPTYMNNVRNGFISPGSAPYSSRFGYYNNSGSGVCAGGGSTGFPEVQTDTPPQTPPNMKLPNAAGNLMNNSSNTAFTSNNPHISPPTMNGYAPPQGHQPSHYPNNCYGQLANSPQKEKTKMGSSFLQQGQPFSSQPPVPSNVLQSPTDEAAFKPFYK